MSKLTRSPVTLLVLLAGAIGVLLVLYAWRLPPFVTSVETTDNAYVKGYVTIMSPQVAGYVVEVPVRDYQAVKEGDVLARIDERIYRQKVAQARATLAGQKAALDNSRQQEASAKASIASSDAQVLGAKAALRRAELASERVNQLAARSVASTSEVESAQATFEQAKAAEAQAEAAVEVNRQALATIIVNRGSLQAAVAGAEAAVELAEIDLSNTAIRAPRDGHLGEVGVRLGQYVTAGTQLMSVVPSELWVVANYKETQLDGMKVGQPVTFSVDALEHQRLTGHVQRFSPATGSEFSVIRPDNATGNFTKIAQRVGVRISIDPGQAAAERLAPGLSVVVRIDKSLEPDAKVADAE
ncbi:HlyD family secretion protein [Rhizobium sp. DKSPLA3]|uniref:HlyD family secretion protein n=1 Tax=Rhizobium quercicola TaxID=2901226 RepID=A0A9X1T6Q0_9HYPH|nr:HlyD family secretion protein [Rhizobium quercicola]MCD7108973.1 HlyD family secretion protein [Rhizobium quercicola]